MCHSFKPNGTKEPGSEVLPILLAHTHHPLRNLVLPHSAVTWVAEPLEIEPKAWQGKS